MKRKKWTAWFLCLALILAFATETGYGADAGKTGIFVEAAKLADNKLTLTVSMEDVTFNGVQLALKYDKTRLTYSGSHPVADYLKLAEKDLTGGTVELVAYVDPSAPGTDEQHYYTINSKEGVFEVTFSVTNTKLYRDSIKLGSTSANETGVLIANKVQGQESQGLSDPSMVSIDLSAAGVLNEDTPSGSGGGGGAGGGGGGGGSSAGTATPETGDKKDTQDEQSGGAGDDSKAQLSDIQNHWAAKSIAKLVEAGLVSGYEDGSFRPEQSLSRSEFAIILCKLAGVAPSTEPNSFSDTAGHWAQGYTEAAYRQGFTGGVGDGLFAPDANITRQELVVMLINYLEKTKGAMEKEAQLTFKDMNQIENWALLPMKKAVAAGLISGYEDGTVLPANPVTRAEMTAIVEKLL